MAKRRCSEIHTGPRTCGVMGCSYHLPPPSPPLRYKSEVRRMAVAFKASAEHDVGELGSALEGLREHNERLETQKRLLLAQVRGEEGEEGRTGQESCGCWRSTTWCWMRAARRRRCWSTRGICWSRWQHSTPR